MVDFFGIFPQSQWVLFKTRWVRWESLVPIGPSFRLCVHLGKALSEIITNCNYTMDSHEFKWYHDPLIDIEMYIVDCNFTFQQPQLFFSFFLSLVWGQKALRSQLTSCEDRQNKLYQVSLLERNSVGAHLRQSWNLLLVEGHVLTAFCHLVNSVKGCYYKHFMKCQF